MLWGVRSDFKVYLAGRREPSEGQLSHIINQWKLFKMFISGWYFPVFLKCHHNGRVWWEMSWLLNKIMSGCKILSLETLRCYLLHVICSRIYFACNTYNLGTKNDIENVRSIQGDQKISAKETQIPGPPAWQLRVSFENKCRQINILFLPPPASVFTTSTPSVSSP